MIFEHVSYAWIHLTALPITSQSIKSESVIQVEFTALFDSGTSFTYLVDPTYSRLSESASDKICFHLARCYLKIKVTIIEVFMLQFHSDRRCPSDSMTPFEYCY